ncbi:MAG: hypothetical protein E6H55_13695 [Betaproteobacteria bacterium]|nr:MAG: hypothetical protein E6H55_13695 [Betaproteobacteria bacterium]
MWEIWGALIHGGRLVLVPHLVSRDPEEFHALLIYERVTILNQTPSAFRQLIAVDAHENAGENLALRVVILGGEALDFQSLRPWFDRHGDAKPQLFNMYGITETTVHVTCRPIASVDLDAASGSMIGEPIPDLQLLLLDRHLQPVPPGMPGEIFVGGPGVGRGYLNRPELTAERFLANPFSTDPRSRLYRSGDLARRTSDNDLEYLGRVDLQVKIRGFRVECGEVEALLKQHEPIREAVVLAREDRPGEKRLIAYIVPVLGRTPILAELRRFLLTRLPDYMVPAAFVTLDALPLTANGKIDRSLLAASDPQFEVVRQAHVFPRNAVEVQLMRIWERILDVSPIGMRDNFFALGGDSLAAVRVIDRIEQLFDRQLQPDMLWYQEGTIESLAHALVDDSGPPLWAGPVAIKASGMRRPLFCPHVVGGHLFFYDNLARHLAADQPLYGLPARGIDGKAPPDTRIEAMAAHCIGGMKQVQPKGPYRIAGYCSGGSIAFEMARQLHARGETVEFLALCDSVAPGVYPLELARTIWNFLRLKNVRPVQQRLYRFVLQHLGLSHRRKFRTVTEAHYWAHLSYRPRMYPGGAILFRSPKIGSSRSPSLGWSRKVNSFRSTLAKT